MGSVWTILGAATVLWLLWPRKEQAMRAHELYIVGLIKHGEVYTYTFVDSTRRDTLRTIGRQACHPDLSLDWRDAYILEQKITAVTHQP